TIASIQTRYQLDSQYGQQVASRALRLLEQAGGEELIAEPQGKVLLETTAKLHEIGLTIDYKKGGEHSAYLLQHLDLPGFTRAQKFFIGELARRYRDQLTSLPEQHALSGNSAKRVLRLLRLAVLLSHRRRPELEPQITLIAENDKLTLQISAGWLAQNPLTAAELETEANRQTDIGWPMVIKAN
ncbi:guanosine-5'-triphosphate,3'-diphosphate pyrophosphatase, partial [Vibrio parahaemolyticus]|nr:guanosine-5'-triphosphate,3'-diphosphate pyrophosphatase [Vibrio parahaemolyticus]NMS17752.1 guanosine-5'-triphosphate,3'-diphosphate pyrophosphatase [Vibrio parahaemolyticus]